MLDPFSLTGRNATGYRAASLELTLPSRQLNKASIPQCLRSVEALELSVRHSLDLVSAHSLLLLIGSVSLFVRRYKVSHLHGFRSHRLAATERHNRSFLLREDRSCIMHANVCLPTRFQNAEVHVLD